MRHYLISATLLTLCFTGQVALAQTGAVPRGNGPRGNPGRGGGDTLPAVGSILPTVSAFDEQGNAFSTSSLRGNYTVLVFGCLT